MFPAICFAIIVVNWLDLVTVQFSYQCVDHRCEQIEGEKSSKQPTDQRRQRRWIKHQREYYSSDQPEVRQQRKNPCEKLRTRPRGKIYAQVSTVDTRIHFDPTLSRLIIRIAVSFVGLYFGFVRFTINSTLPQLSHFDATTDIDPAAYRKISSPSSPGVLMHNLNHMSLSNSHANYVDIDQIDQMRLQPDASFGLYDFNKFQRNYSMNQNHPHTFDNHFGLMQTYSGSNLAEASPFTKQYSTTRKELQARHHMTSPVSSSSLPKTNYLLDNSPIYENQQQLVDMARSESPIYSNTNSSLMSLYHTEPATASSLMHQALRDQSSINSGYLHGGAQSDLLQQHQQANIYSNIMPNDMPLYSNVRTSIYDIANSGLSYNDKLLHSLRHVCISRALTLLSPHL